MVDLKQLMADDLKNTFYKTDEFAIAVLYQDKFVPALHVDANEIFDSDVFVLSFVAVDVANITLDDEMIVEGKTYTVGNFSFKDDFKIEVIVSLNEV